MDALQAYTAHRNAFVRQELPIAAKKVSAMPVAPMEPGSRTEPTPEVLAVFQQLRQDFTALLTAMKAKELTAAQPAVAAPPQEAGKMPNQESLLPGAESSSCSGSALAEQLSWPVLSACSLFASQEKETAAPPTFSISRSGKRGTRKNQYKCTKCGNLVVDDQTLRPDELNCPICSGRLVFRGCVR